MSVAVIIATYGDKDHWDRMAMPAILSAEEQTRPPEQIIRSHGSTLHGARNAGALEAKTEWLCFLDGDDELDSSYIGTMLDGAGDLRWPRVIYATDGIREDCWMQFHHFDNILNGNYMVIGTLVRRRQFLRLRGFRDLPVLEDWDLWIRCIRDGAKPNLVCDAYYIVGRSPNSRNKTAEAILKQTHQQFREEYGTLNEATGEYDLKMTF